MGEVVNLRQARKRAARKSKEAEAEAKRVAFGLSASLNARVDRESSRREAALEGHRLDPAGDPSKRRDSD